MSDGVAPPSRRATRARSLIRQTLDSTDKFLSAQGLHELITAQGEDVGLATVYRTLQMFADDGEVDFLRDDDGEMLYRKCVRNAHHHHLICRRCGTTHELADTMIESWAHQVADQHGYSDVSHSIELYGTCSDCGRLG
ncbi:Fur family transcriptional regulator [Flaviflexus equikiangi]|uniref:Transcriptional repressor n=1 Tax=Flaviflexus equikiangi TaxID=2758573 RepID=A0ABS2THB3_9ACTO|nr:Fur family transcriptional regulator [Flaviflexus equikiangi]MBM9433172.1 transcriptional repressor [Flaviflexus equikiangi]